MFKKQCGKNWLIQELVKAKRNSGERVIWIHKTKPTNPQKDDAYFDADSNWVIFDGRKWIAHRKETRFKTIAYVENVFY